MNEVTGQEVGRLQAEVVELRRITDSQTKLIQHISEQLNVVQATLSEARGGWRMLLLVGGAGAAMGTLVTKIALWALSLPGVK